MANFRLLGSETLVDGRQDEVSDLINVAVSGQLDGHLSFGDVRRYLREELVASLQGKTRARCWRR